jgi:hypothetical protein
MFYCSLNDSGLTLAGSRSDYAQGLRERRVSARGYLGARHGVFSLLQSMQFSNAQGWAQVHVSAR